MTIKLHRCSGTAIKGRHPCWVAQKALDDAGIEYELVKHAALRPFRNDVKAMTGQKKVPLVEFEDDTFLRESKAIAERAAAGTLHGPGETAPFAD